MTRQALATQTWPEFDLWGPHKSGRREWLHRIVLLPQTCYSAHIIILRIAIVFHCPNCVVAGSMCLWVQACGGRRDHWVVPWSCWQCEQPSVDAGEPAQALWKSSKCFGLLSYLSSLRNKFKRKQLKVVLNPYTPCYAQQMFPIDTDFCWNMYSLICVHLSHLLTIQTAHWIIFMEKCQLHYWHYSCFSFSLMFWKEVYLF